MLNGHRASLHFLLLLFGLAVVGAAGASAQDLAVADRGPRFLRQVSAAEPPIEIDMNATPVLRRRVSLTGEAMTLGQILGAIRRQAGLKFIYSTDVVPADRAVGLRADSITVAAALTEILLDAGVDVVFYSAREAGLVLREPPQKGTIAGTVTDGKTGGAIAGATVVIERTSLSATTDNNGHYRITEVAPGTYNVRARYIGYASGAVTVTVSAGQEATADFALEKSAQRLDEVVTTGTVVPTAVRALPTPVSIITARDIAVQHPRDLQSLFRQVVPTAVSFDNPAAPYYTAFSVRGATTLAGQTGQMKVLVDGVEAASQSVAAIDPSAIERIEIVRGPQAAAMYGSEAIGGVVQVFTKRGDPEIGRPQLDVQAAGGLLQTPYQGFNGVLRQSYTASLRGSGADVSYNLGASYSHMDDFVPNGELSRQSTPSVYGGVNVERGVLNLDLSGRYYNQNAPVVINPEFAQTGYSFYSKPLFQAQQYQTQVVGARLSISQTSWWKHIVTAGVDRTTQVLEQTQPRLTTPDDTLLTLFNQSWSKTSIGFSTAVSGSVGPSLFGSLTAGFDHYTIPYSRWSTSGAVAANGSIQTAPNRPIRAARATTNNTGYFAQMQFAFREALFATAGLRAEENTNFGDQLGTPVSPRVGVSYSQDVGQAILKVRGSWGRAIRSPASGLKLGNAGVFGVTLPNPQLGPERQQGWDAGLDLVLGHRFSLSATYYRQVADQLIDLVTIDPAATPPTSQNQNIGRVKNSGVELEGTFSIVDAVQLRGQYGYARSRVDQLAPGYTGDLRVGDQTRLTPEHTAGAWIIVTPKLGSTISAGLTYVGNWTGFDNLAEARCFGETGPCQPTQRDYFIVYPGFTKVNATVSQQVTQTLAGFVSLDNLTNNKAFEVDNASPVVGRTTTVGLRFHY